MRARSEALAPPFGAIERPRFARETSALTPEDLETPAVIRRATADLGRDLAACAGHTEWRDLDPETRREMREVLVAHYERRLGDARMQARLLVGVAGTVPLAQAVRIAKLERGLAAARRLP
jgi:hypothetical protein